MLFLLSFAANLKANELPLHIKNTLHKVVLSSEYQTINPPKYFVLVDFSAPSSEQRLWLYSSSNNVILQNCWVAHGQLSGKNIPEYFSNAAGSHKSSVGLFMIGDRYIGSHGESIVLEGLEKGINDNAKNRHLVIHSANYVNEKFIKQHGRIGRSWGCLALSPNDYEKLSNIIHKGDLVIIYGREPNWLDHSLFLHS